MTEVTGTIENNLSVEIIWKGAPRIVFDYYQKHYTKVIATLGRICRDWTQGETNGAVEAIIEEIHNPGDSVVFTDGSVKRGVKSGWAYTVRVNGDVIAEGSGADGSQDKN